MRTPSPTGKIIGREALAVLAATLLHPFGWIKSRRRTPRLADQRTLVLVHGYLANGACFTALRAYLRLVGHETVLTYGYKPSESVDAAAIGLKDFLRANVRGGRIDLVCHSLGGLVAMVYLSALGGARRVDRCITLGTPLRGTYSAYWLTGRTARDLRPGSPLLQKLRFARARARSVRFTSIVAGSDNIVLPRVSGHRRTDTVVVPGVGHTGLLFSPEVFRVVAERLAVKPRLQSRRIIMETAR